jgi:glyoxylase-like metal-dependent hydrolase (beta-lactamase superfamily II)
MPSSTRRLEISAVKIIPLKKSDKVYSCNSYLILGDWNRVEDLNTVIDPGTDDFVLEEIGRSSTGCGKVAVEQVILTHNHFDHGGGVMALKKRYGARVLAFANGPGVDGLLRDGRFIKAGDEFLEVIHTPGHSSDSICLYAPSAQTLFSGDTQVRIRSPGDVYTQDYLDGLVKLAGRKILSIYSGHDEPITGRARETILETLANVRNSRIVTTDMNDRSVV